MDTVLIKNTSKRGYEKQYKSIETFLRIFLRGVFH